MPFQKLDRSVPPPALGVPIAPFPTTAPAGPHELPPMPLGFSHQQPPTPHLGYPTGHDAVFGFLPQGLPQLPSTPPPPAAPATLTTPASPHVPAPSPVVVASSSAPHHADPAVPSDDDLEKAFAALTASGAALPTPQASQQPALEEADDIVVPMSFLIQPQDSDRPASTEGSRVRDPE
ncbi:Hypothetical protein, putative [Bodo saltans]|uniref:Uncharacterized protein n=1 Tax=Bodo saltans TaxID=75058 RepID=A0A0S4JMV9_BODSA|nr:Hypothetical protein, putative [Bodo saltans]|eukprot:CUG92809.1 Hypothetical protein, putative [Bodo saltans]